MEADFLGEPGEPPRRSPTIAERIDACIVSEYYHVPPGTTLTICVVKLTNDMLVVGESAFLNPAMYDAEKGQRLALENAKNKIPTLAASLFRGAQQSQLR